MILEFTIDNILSFRNKTTISMVANSKKDLKENVVELNDERVLKTVVFYGANSAGKTNVFKALGHFLALIRHTNNYDINSSIPFHPFKFNSKNKTSSFNIVFIKDDIKYDYGYEHDEKDIISEHLYFYPNKRKALIFERTNINNLVFPQKDNTFLNKQKNELLHNQLFLSYITNRNYDLTKPAYDFLTQDISIIDDLESLKHLSQKILFENNNNKKLKNSIINYLKNADINISDYEIQKVIIPEKILANLPEGTKIKDLYTTFFTHTYENKSFKLNILDESAGTNLLFYLLPYLFNVLSYNSILFIDELDKSIHPLILEQLVTYFNNSSKYSQLIFNVNDTILLNKKTLRRDQIWFVDKSKKTGSSSVSLLTSYHPRNDDNLERLYLIGKYKGIPDIR